MGLTRLAEIHAGGFGVARTRLLLAETQGPGRVELTDEGGPPVAGNTLVPEVNSGMVITALRVTVFNPATGWMGCYGAADVMVTRGAGSVLTLAPAVPRAGLLRQAGTPPGSVAVGLEVRQGRVVLALTTDSAMPLHGVAEVETLEVR